MLWMKCGAGMRGSDGGTVSCSTWDIPNHGGPCVVHRPGLGDRVVDIVSGGLVYK